MNARFVPLALIAALLLAFGAIAAACGGGGEPLTIEDYFQRAEALDNEAEERSEALGQDFDEEIISADSQEERLRALQDFYAASLPFFQDFVDGIADLNPPREIEDEHNAFAEAGADSLNSFEDLIDKLKEAESESDLQDLFAEIDADPAFERFDDTCLALQGIADENSIDVNLGCGIEEL